MKTMLQTLGALEPPIMIVAHDAGAANHIASWFGASIMRDVYVSFAGPAREIFERQCPWMPAVDYREVLPRCKTLISGTGWASTLEHEARRMAGQSGCRSIAVVDHWTNYRERFVRDGEELLPNEIWVTDEYAKSMAESEFPNMPIVQVQNAYLEGLVSMVHDHEQARDASHSANVLYVLEPIRQPWGAGEVLGEFQALDFFLMNRDVIDLAGEISLRLRPHPSDAPGKYDRWIEVQQGLDISLDASRSLEASIAWADVVVGCHTYAMVVALAAGKHVVSSVPPWAPACMLPQAGITKMAERVH